MANYFYNDYEFPELPSWDKATYPIAVIVKAHSSQQGVYGGEYVLMVGKNFNNSARVLLTGLHKRYKPEGGAWVETGSSYTELAVYYASGGVTYVEPIWTNTNVPKPTGSSEILLYKSDPVPMAYTVSYNKGPFGTGTNTTDTKNHGVALTLKGAIFTRGDYTQTGWSTSFDGAKAYNLSASYTANAPITLYPYWTKNDVPEVPAPTINPFSRLTKRQKFICWFMVNRIRKTNEEETS